jgi:beta-mannosidase
LYIKITAAGINMKKLTEIVLGQNWQFRKPGDKTWLPAKVPGTVHTDLKNHQLIDDPFFRLNENLMQWVEDEDWEYRTEIYINKSLLENDAARLIFEGLDTYAEVFLNGNLLLNADNMFVGYQVPCKQFLKPGNNELHIIFRSPVKTGLKKMTTAGYQIPAPNELSPAKKRTSPFTRKAPFHYGWDWGPRMVTSGIWRPVRLLFWRFAHLESVYVFTKSVQNNSAAITAEVEIHALQAGLFSVEVIINDKIAESATVHFNHPGQRQLSIDLVVDHPRLWWPNGLGEPYLYHLEFRLIRNNVVIHQQNIKHGIKILELIQKPDEAGHTFYFRINNLPVFMKGANIIPPEVLTPETTKETYHRLIAGAVEANMNMLRVWGGGIYPDDYFYDLCSANGLLVWQDFMFACALQPGDAGHLENIRIEAAYNIQRLRNHTCLALWCGNNENLTGWHNWGWQEMYKPDRRKKIWNTYQSIFHRILPDAVKTLDAKTPYRTTSPASFFDELPDRKSGDEHDWSIWFGQKPITAFWENVPRFVSEWGLQSFPHMATIRSFADREDIWLHSAVMQHRQRSRMDWLEPGFNGNDMIKWYMSQYFDIPENFDDFVYVSQLMQTMGCKTAIEAHRSSMPHCMGTLYWQLNDCWPTVSWSTMDYYFRQKAAHYAVKKAFSPVIITARIRHQTAEVFAVSDDPQTTKASLKFVVTDFFGETIYQFQKDVSVPANAAQLITNYNFGDLLSDDMKRKCFLYLSLSKHEKLLAENHYFFVNPKDLILPSPQISSRLLNTANGYTLILESPVLVKSLMISLPDADAQFSDNYFDLLPGRKAKVDISSQLPHQKINAFNFKWLGK